MVYYVMFKFMVLLLEDFTAWFTGCWVPYDLFVLVVGFVSGF